MHGVQTRQGRQVGGPWVAVGADGTGAACQADPSGLIALKREHLVIDRDDFFSPGAVTLCLQGALMAVAGVTVHRLAAQAITAREVVGRGDHVQARRRVVQRFPEKILELHFAAETKAAPVGVGGNRVTRHRFTGHA